MDNYLSGEKKKKLLFLSFFFIFIVFAISSSVNAIPPFIQASSAETAEGLIISYPKLEYVRQNSEFTFHFHVNNQSTGTLLTNSTTSCRLHIYNDSGSHILERETIPFDSNGVDFYLKVAKGNFTKVGAYSYLVGCNTSRIGGFDSVPFEVTGENNTLGIASFRDTYAYIYSILLALIFMLLILARYYSYPWFAIISGFLLSVLALVFRVIGIPTITNEFLIASITIILAGLGLLIMGKTAMEIPGE